MTTNICPKCKADLTGEEIPEEFRELHYGGKTHYSRKIGIYDWDRDMTVEWMCPDCEHRWPREFAREYIAKEKE